MHETVQFLERHDYWVLVGAILGRQACLPIPANLLLVAAGALARSGRLTLSGIFAVSVLTFLCADLAWYEAGRRLGDRMLHFACGLSRNPGSCVHKANDAFSKRGVRTLLFSKFVVGLDAVAAPLAGKSRVSPVHFVTFDSVGAAFWTATYVALGYVFRDQLDVVATHIARMGTFMALAIAAGVCFYLVRRFVRWHRFVREFRLRRITPEQLSNKLNAGEDIMIVDLQGGRKSAAERMCIPGAVCIDPRALERSRDVRIFRFREIILYCGCPGEYTSARVALVLREKGIDRVRPLAGGLRAWRECGFPVTSTLSAPAALEPTKASA
jgi:membrane protein DedA with SNARE-associated domain/rhodanese-related sulfurtransferase